METILRELYVIKQEIQELKFLVQQDMKTRKAPGEIYNGMNEAQLEQQFTQGVIDFDPTVKHNKNLFQDATKRQIQFDREMKQQRDQGGNFYGMSFTKNKMDYL